MPKLTGGYFGTRGPDMFSPDFLKSIRKTSAFIDITAGTGQFPYYLATEKGMTVGLIERCPYVGMLLYSIFTPGKIGKINWDPDPKEGYLYEQVEVGKLSNTFTTRTAQAIDGFMHDNQDHPLALHCLARVVGRYFTFRNHNFCKIGPTKEATLTYKPDFILDAAYRIYLRMTDLRLKNGKHWVTIGDSVEELEKFPAKMIKGATVYADPAWPYSKKQGGTNPYIFAYEDLSSIMLQEQLKLNGLWTLDKPKRIYRDIERWIDTAFDRGAAQFILCSQDTNFPSEDELKAWLKKRKDWRIIKHERSDDFSSFSNRKYLTYWFYIEPR